MGGGSEPMCMEMVMTFQPWSCDVQILFAGWDPKNGVQYTLSWFAIAIACIGYHALRYKIEEMEVHRAVAFQKEEAGLDGADLTENLLNSGKKQGGAAYGSTNSYEVTNDGITNQPMYYLTHSVLVALGYGLSLMLMLVAMTYNPGLFLALMVGWGVGDFIFHRKSSALRRQIATHTDRDTTACH